MKATRLSSFFLLFCVALFTASCSVFSSQRLSNIRMARDETGKTPANSYTPLQTFCVISDVSGVKPGSLIQARWFVTSAQGVAPDTRINTSDYIYKAGVGHVYFKLSTWDDSSWPVGSYKVVLLLDGVQVGEQAFAVQ